MFQEDLVLARRVTSTSNKFFLNRKIVKLDKFMIVLEYLGIVRTELPTTLITSKTALVFKMYTSEKLLNFTLCLVEPALVLTYPEVIAFNRKLHEMIQKAVSINNDAIFETDVNEMSEVQSLLKKKDDLLQQKKDLEIILYSKLIKKNELKQKKLKQMKASLLKETAYLDSKEEISGKLKSLKAKKEDLKDKLNDLNENYCKLLSNIEKYSLKLLHLKQKINFEVSDKLESQPRLEEFSMKYDKISSELSNLRHDKKKNEDELFSVQQRLDNKKAEIVVLLSKMNSMGHSSEVENQPFVTKQPREIQIELDNLLNLQTNTKKHIDQIQLQLNHYKGKIQDMLPSNVLDTAAEEHNREVKRNHAVLEKVLSELEGNQHCIKKDAQIHQENAIKLKLALQKKIGKGIVKGIESLWKVLSMVDTADLFGYYDIIINLIKVDSCLNLALESAIGKRLFFHAVKNAQTSTLILKKINENKLPGEVWFIVEDQLKSPTNIGIVEQDVRPLKDLVDYPPSYESIINFVLANIFVCKDLETASRISKKYKVTCVTLEGDRVSSNGLMSGGHIDMRNTFSPIWKELIKEESCLPEIELKLDDLSNKIAKTKDEILQSTVLINQLRPVKTSEYERINQVDRLTNMISLLEKQLSESNTLLTDTTVRISVLEERYHKLQDGRSQEMVGSQEIENSLVQLNTEINDLVKRVSFFKTRCIMIDSKIKRNESDFSFICKMIALEKSSQYGHQKHLSNSTIVQEKINGWKEKLGSVKHDIQLTNELLLSVDKEIVKLKETIDSSTGQSGRTKMKRGNMNLNRVEGLLKNVSETLVKCNKQLMKVNPGHSGSALASTQFSDSKLGQIRCLLEDTNKKLKNLNLANMKIEEHFRSNLSLKETLTKWIDNSSTIEKWIVDAVCNMTESISVKVDKLNLNTNQLLKKFNDSLDVKIHLQKLHNHGDKNIITGAELEVIYGKNSNFVVFQSLSSGQISTILLSLLLSSGSIQQEAPMLLFDDVDWALDRGCQKIAAELIEEYAANRQIIAASHNKEFLSRAHKFFRLTSMHENCMIQEVSQEGSSFAEEPWEDSQPTDTSSSN